MRSWGERRRARKVRRRIGCLVDEESIGYFIGRRHCTTHSVVWDDGGTCPRFGEEPGQPFTFADRMPGERY